MFLAKHFGARLRELREARGLTQSELGHAPYVCDVEAGRKAPTFRRAEAFAADLHCHVLDLFSRPPAVQGEQGR